jgi:hypothetical protein
MKTFSDINGIPIHYARLPNYPYGSRGKSYTFKCHQNLIPKLEAVFSDIEEKYGRPEIITSAGAYVNKSGEHGKGMAFDLDGIFWSDREFVTKHDGYGRRNITLYVVIDAIFRKQFGVVLNFDYNAAHRDHFHVDSSVDTGLTSGSRSKILFLQRSLREIWGKDIQIDGKYGVTTQIAHKEVIGMSSSWLDYLGATIKKGVTGVTPVDPPQEPDTPLTRLRKVYGAIYEELGDTSLRPAVEAPLNEFANHIETQAWLDRYRDA